MGTHHPGLPGWVSWVLGSFSFFPFERLHPSSVSHGTSDFLSHFQPPPDLKEPTCKYLWTPLVREQQKHRVCMRVQTRFCIKTQTPVCKSRDNTPWPPAIEVSEGKYFPFRWYWGSFVQCLKLNVIRLLNFHCGCKLVAKNKPRKQNRPKPLLFVSPNCSYRLTLKLTRTIFLTGELSIFFLPTPLSLSSFLLFLFLSCDKCIHLPTTSYFGNGDISKNDLLLNNIWWKRFAIP